MVMKLDLEDRLNFAIHIAKQLSQKQLAFSNKHLQLQRKGDDSPVTQADLESESYFREEVNRVFPEDKIVGEEQGADSESGPKWVIDPIDGTRKFMRGLPFWGICIAFEVEQNVELGVIAVPGALQVWSAQRGQGAFRNSQKIEVDNQIDSLNRAFITMPARPYFLKDSFEPAYDKTQSCIEHDPGFLDAYSYGMVADGRIHGVLSCSDMWWDIAAAVCIIEEAGGVFTDIKGNKPKEGSLNLAASKVCHELLLKKLENI
jgi:histidinol phosphatase-like enzyme (inositol monophosphatase family)